MQCSAWLCWTANSCDKTCLRGSRTFTSAITACVSTAATATVGRPLQRVHPSSVLFRTQLQLLLFLGANLVFSHACVVAVAAAAAAAAAGRPLKLRVHPSSVLFRTQPQLLLFLGCQQNEEGWYEMTGVTAIQPEWLTELAPGVFQRA